MAAAAALLIGLGRYVGGPESGQLEHIVDESVPLTEPESVASDTETGTVSFDASSTDTVDGEDHTMTVHVEAEEGAFPEGVTMSVETVDDPEVLESIRDAVEGETGTVHAVTITFTDETGAEVQPEDGYTVNMTLSSDAVQAVQSEESLEGSGSDVNNTKEEPARDSEGKEGSARPSPLEEPPANQNEPEQPQNEAEPGKESDQENGEQSETENSASELAVVQYAPEEESAQTVETTEGTDPSGEEVSFTSGDAPIYALVEVISEQEEGETSDQHDPEPGGEASSGESVASPSSEDQAEEGEEEPASFPEEVEPSEIPEETVLVAEGEDYIITVTYGPDAGIPEGASLSVRELLPETEEYDDHYAQTQEVLDTGSESDAAAETFSGPGEETRDPRFFGVHSMVASLAKSEPIQEDQTASPEIVFCPIL